MDDLALFLETVYEREPVTLDEAIEETIKRTGLLRISVLKLYFMSKKRNLINVYCNNRLKRNTTRKDVYLSLKPYGIKYLQKRLEITPANLLLIT
jgi:hypothetical protein